MQKIKRSLEESIGSLKEEETELLLRRKKGPKEGAGFEEEFEQA